MSDISKDSITKIIERLDFLEKTGSAAYWQVQWQIDKRRWPVKITGCEDQLDITLGDHNSCETAELIVESRNALPQLLEFCKDAIPLIEMAYNVGVDMEYENFEKINEFLKKHGIGDEG